MIILIPPSRRSVREVLSSIKTLPVRWVYLGDSIRTMRQVTRWLGLEAKQINIAQTLQEIAGSLRRPYIDYIGKLGAEQESIRWWFSSLSEKDSVNSKLFLQICYVATSVRLSQRVDSEALIIVTESLGVCQAITQNLRERNIRFSEITNPSLSRGFVVWREWIEMVGRKAWHAGRYLWRMITARILKFQPGVLGKASATDVSAWTLLHNWVEQRAFDKNGHYQDIFFGSLREELQRRGVPVAVVVGILPGSSYWRLLVQLKRTGLPLLLPHAALTLSDWIKHCFSYQRAPHSRNWPRFHGFDISALISEVERRDWLLQRSEEALVTASVVARWRQRLDVQAFIYTYEGHIWERAYCYAFRKHFPMAKLIGYQHSTVAPMWLNHFFSETEWNRVPSPDRVVTNGRYHYEMLRKDGIPEQVLSCGGALRYKTFGSDASASSTGGSDRSVLRVLATFSIFPTQAAELLLAVLEAFQDPSRFQVFLKFHPLLPAVRVAAEAGFALCALPAHMQVTEKPLSQLLKGTRGSGVLAYTDTTAAIEALAHGVPVAHLLSNYAIDMDRLGSFDGTRVSVETAGKLRTAVENLVKAGPEECAVRVLRGREVVELLLPAPDDRTIDLFMPDSFRGARPSAGHVATNVR